MAAFASLGALRLAGFATANTYSNFSIPIEISSRQGVFPNQGRNYFAKILEGYATVQGQYEISAKYCQPDDGNASTIQIFYWDLAYNNYNYSYVKVANAAGYSTLAIYRLVIGNSSHGEPINKIQAQLKVEALNAVTTLLRAGKIPEIKKRYGKIIHVGHSFGSIQSYWLSALYRNNTDGLTVPAWNLHSARLNQPLCFADAPNSKLRAVFSGWFKNSSLIQAHQTLLKVSHCDLTANQLVFLRYGAYDIGLGVITEQTEQPVTIGKLLTTGGAPAEDSFGGPVIIFTGEFDEAFCGLDCYATGGSNTGHRINVHYNSTAGNEYVQRWLAANGPGA
ncbi:hypothetical protein PSPO01_05192 [Paraphaeosphaeria sporulosa]